MSRAGESFTEGGCIPGPRLSRSSSLVQVEKPFGDRQISPVLEDSQEDETCKSGYSIFLEEKNPGHVSTRETSQSRSRGIDTAEDKTTTACLSLSSSPASPNFYSTGDQTSSFSKGEESSRDVHHFSSTEERNLADEAVRDHSLSPTGWNDGASAGKCTFSRQDEGCLLSDGKSVHSNISLPRETNHSVVPSVSSVCTREQRSSSSSQCSGNTSTLFTDNGVSPYHQGSLSHTSVLGGPPRKARPLSSPVYTSDSGALHPQLTAHVNGVSPSPYGHREDEEIKPSTASHPQERRPSCSSSSHTHTAETSVEGGRHLSAPPAEGCLVSRELLHSSLQTSSGRGPGQRFVPVSSGRRGSYASSSVDGNRSIPSVPVPLSHSIGGAAGAEDTSGTPADLARLNRAPTNTAHASYLEHFYMQQSRLAANEFKRREEARREMTTWHGAVCSKEFQWHQRLRESSAGACTAQTSEGLRLISLTRPVSNPSEGRRSRSDGVRQQHQRVSRDGESRGHDKENGKRETFGAHACASYKGREECMVTAEGYHYTDSSSNNSGRRRYVSSLMSKNHGRGSDGIEEKMRRDEERSSRLVKHLISLFQTPRQTSTSDRHKHSTRDRMGVGDSLTQQRSSGVSKGLMSSLPPHPTVVSCTGRAEGQRNHGGVFISPQAVHTGMDQKTVVARSMMDDIRRSRPLSSPLLRHAPPPSSHTSSHPCSSPANMTPRGSICSLPPSFTVPTSPAFNGRRCRGGSVAPLPPPGFSRDEVLVIQDALRRYSARGQPHQPRQGGYLGRQGSAYFLQQTTPKGYGTYEIGRRGGGVHDTCRLPQKHIVVQSPSSLSQAGTTPHFHHVPLTSQGLGRGKGTPEVSSPRVVIASPPCDRNVSTHPVTVPSPSQQTHREIHVKEPSGHPQPQEEEEEKQKEAGLSSSSHTVKGDVGVVGTSLEGSVEAHEKVVLSIQREEGQGNDPVTSDKETHGGSPGVQGGLERCGDSTGESPSTTVQGFLPQVKTSMSASPLSCDEGESETKIHEVATPPVSSQSASFVGDSLVEQPQRGDELASKQARVVDEDGPSKSNEGGVLSSQEECTERGTEVRLLEVTSSCGGEKEEEPSRQVLRERKDEISGQEQLASEEKPEVEQQVEIPTCKSEGNGSSTGTEGGLRLPEDRASDNEGDLVGDGPLSGVCTAEKLDTQESDNEENMEGVARRVVRRLEETSAYTRSVPSLSTEKGDEPHGMQLEGEETAALEERDSSNEDAQLVQEDATVTAAETEELQEESEGGLGAASVGDVCSPSAEDREIAELRTSTEKEVITDQNAPCVSSPSGNDTSSSSAYLSSQEAEVPMENDKIYSQSRPTLEDALLQLADCFAAAAAASNSSDVQTRETEGRRKEGLETTVGQALFLSENNEEEPQRNVDLGGLSEGNQHVEVDGRNGLESEHCIEGEPHEPLKPYEQIMLKFLRYRDWWESQGGVDEEAASRALDDVLPVLDQVSSTGGMVSPASQQANQGMHAENEEEAKLHEIDALLESIPDFTRESNLFSGFGGGYDTLASDTAADAGLFIFPQRGQKDEEDLFLFSEEEEFDMDGRESGCSSPASSPRRGLLSASRRSSADDFVEESSQGQTRNREQEERNQEESLPRQRQVHMEEKETEKGVIEEDDDDKVKDSIKKATAE
ncbi:hypothetical protein CSUI_010351, partial [Cystoisospora suis]